jgi:hypothetical protein
VLGACIVPTPSLLATGYIVLYLGIIHSLCN